MAELLAESTDIATRELDEQLKRLGAVLDDRATVAAALDDYYDGDHPLPPLVQEAKLTKAYRTLMALTTSNWPQLIVDSANDRLEVTGLRFGNKQADDDVWGIWQENSLDDASSILHESALTTGRAFAIVWATGTGQNRRPLITTEHASFCVVEYLPGTRERVVALRRWLEGGRWYATLYRPEALYKFQARSGSGTASGSAPTGVQWEKREVDGEAWPLPNTMRRVNVVEFAVNRDLRPSRYGRARGEFQRNVRHIDRINYKVFCGLVALTWSGFPLRALIGDPILKDDDDKPIQPFDVIGSSVVQLENPEGKLVQLPGADMKAFSPEQDIQHLAALTKTPPHYLLGEMVNLSADAIRAAEAALVAKVRKHQRSLGESWEEVARLGLLARDAGDARGRDARAEVIWEDPESRSLAERADAATKLSAVLPWQALAEKVIEATPQEIRRWEGMRAQDVLAQAVAAAVTPPAGTAPAVPVPPASGNGAG